MYFANFNLHFRYGILFWGGDGASKKMFKLQKSVMQLISNVGGDRLLNVFLTVHHEFTIY